jgi:tetratricopeptide (TPR) repeat protein
MTFLKFRFAVACPVFFFFCLVSEYSFAADPQWVEIKSPNFSVITDAGDKRGREVALHFEQMRFVFGTLMTKAQVSESVPLQIVALRTSKEMRKMSPLFEGKPIEMAGLFQGSGDRNFIVLDMSVENPWSVVFHEYAHQLMKSNLSVRTDPWFDEGFAEYFSSIEVDNKEARVGRIPEDTYRVLEESGLMKVADLFRVQQDSKTYNETGDHRNVFYEESSLLVHYLYDNRLVAKVAEYFHARFDQHKTIEQAAAQAFGMTPQQLDTVLHDYLTGGRYKYFPIATPSGIAASQFTETPVSVADAQAVLADVDAHSIDHVDRALAEFKDVLKMDPSNVEALRGMGYIYLQRKDDAHAGEYFARAAASDRKDAGVHYYNALLMTRAVSPMDGAHADEVKRELETAIALEPTFGDAFSLLGWVESASGEPEKGLITMKKAMELSPRNEIYQINLANIYMANRKVDEAISLLQALTGSANPEVTSRAATALAQAEQFKEQTKAFGSLVENGSTKGIVFTREVNTSPGTVDGEIHIEAMPSPSTVHFITGKVAEVDCSEAPQALLRVVSGERSLRLRIGDTKQLVLVGVGQFSCDWKNKKVALNYQEQKLGKDDGDVVSLEIQ